MNDIIEIGIYVTGDTWEVVSFYPDGDAEPESIWCETKAEALKEGRALFNTTPTAKRLIAESRRDYCFHTIRER